MKWHQPKPQKPKPCSRCRKGQQIVGKLCGWCYSADVERANKRASRSTLQIGGACCSPNRPMKKSTAKKA